jgi:hypothetical protein
MDLYKEELDRFLGQQPLQIVQSEGVWELHADLSAFQRRLPRLHRERFAHLGREVGWQDHTQTAGGRAFVPEDLVQFTEYGFEERAETIGALLKVRNVDVPVRLWMKIGLLVPLGASPSGQETFAWEVARGELATYFFCVDVGGPQDVALMEWLSTEQPERRALRKDKSTRRDIGFVGLARHPGSMRTFEDWAAEANRALARCGCPVRIEEEPRG